MSKAAGHQRWLLTLVAARVQQALCDHRAACAGYTQLAEMFPYNSEVLSNLAVPALCTYQHPMHRLYVHISTRTPAKRCRIPRCACMHRCIHRSAVASRGAPACIGAYIYAPNTCTYINAPCAQVSQAQVGNSQAAMQAFAQVRARDEHFMDKMDVYAEV